MATYTPESMVEAVRQSPPLDFSTPWNAAWAKDKVIVLTGGSSGFGAGFVEHWASLGATVIFGDIDVERSDALARAVRKKTGRDNVHFVYCDVTKWQSQVNLFKEAIKLSPTGGIDTVVANAGIAGEDQFQRPYKIDTAEPPEPNFRIMDVNCTGLMYTAHLAYYYLPRNPGSEPCSPDSDPATRVRDRNLILMGSIASLAPISAQPQYGAAKHAVLGLYRSLRCSSHYQGIRINMICPYFIETPIVLPAARVMLAGGGMGTVDDVVEATTRLVADSRIVGRSIVIGPRAWVKQKDDGEWEVVEKGTPGSVEKPFWEPCADDWEEVEAFNRNIIKTLNAYQALRGWRGWAWDIAKIVWAGLGFGGSAKKK